MAVIAMSDPRWTGRAPPPGARSLRALERGEDQSFEFTVVIVPVMLVISLIAFATIIRGSI